MLGSSALVQGLRLAAALVVVSTFSSVAGALTNEPSPEIDVVSVVEVVEVVEPASQWVSPLAPIDEQMSQIAAAVTGVDREWLDASTYQALIAGMESAKSAVGAVGVAEDRQTS